MNFAKPRVCDVASETVSDRRAMSMKIKRIRLANKNVRVCLTKEHKFSALKSNSSLNTQRKVLGVFSPVAGLV